MLSQIFKDIILDIYNKGFVSNPRGIKIKELLDYKIIVPNPNNVAFDFNARNFSRRYLASELLWYMSGDKSTKDIQKYASMWYKISNDLGNANSNYGHIVFKRIIKDYINQYNFSLEKLIEDKDSRQSLIRYNSDEHAYKGNKDFVCTISNQFFIRNDKLYMIVNMRSNDLFYGFQYDIVWFSLLMQSICLDLKQHYENISIGEIYHNVGSIHIYEDMFKVADNILKEEKGFDYKLILNKSLLEIKKDIDKNKIKYRKELDKIEKNNISKYKDFIKKIFYIDIK